MSAKAIAHVQLAYKGVFDIEVKHADGTRDYFPGSKNRVVNQGLDALGGHFPTNYGNSCKGGIAVGTSNATPSATDTTLAAPLAYSANWGTMTGTALSTVPPYETQASVTCTFAVGAVVGNIAEIGMTLNRTTGTATASDALFSRALIQVGGSPGTITLLATDQLIVTYTCTVSYANDTTGTLNVTTDGTPVANNFTVRPCRVGYVNEASFYTPFNLIGLPNGNNGYASNQTAFVAVTTNVNHTWQCNSASAVAYTVGSYQLQITAHWNAGTAFSSQLYSMEVTCMSFQILFASAFGPTSAQTLNFNFTIGWANAS